jgi:spore germination protein KB
LKEYISGRQVTFLALGVILGTVFLPIARMVAEKAGRDGWMLIIPAFLSAFPFVYLTLFTYLKAPGVDILQRAKQLLGPWLGYPLAALFCFTSIAFGGLLIRQSTELFSHSIMIEMPFWVLLVGIEMLLVSVVYLGIEVFARFNESIVIPILLSLVFLILFSIPKAELSMLKPFLYNGLKPLIKTFPGIPFGFEYCFFLWILLPFIHKPHEVMRSSFRGLLIISILLTGVVITELCVFTPEEATRMFYGGFSLARSVEIGTIFQGLEPFFIVFWFGASIIKASAFLFCAYFSFKAIFPLRHGLLVVIVGITSSAMALVPESTIDIVKFISIIDNYFILPIASLGICLLAIVSYIKDRRKP